MLNLGITIFRKGWGWGGCATFGGSLLLRFIKGHNFLSLLSRGRYFQKFTVCQPCFNTCLNINLHKPEADEI